jgi:hypothetical protein
MKAWKRPSRCVCVSPAITWPSCHRLNGAKLPVVRLEPLLIGGIYPKNLEDRILINIDQVPPYLLETLVAVEDRDFYSHLGVSPKSIARAIWVNTSSGQMRQGGSTLTQQLVKNFYLTSERSLSRKLTEAMMAMLLELHYSKQRNPGGLPQRGVRRPGRPARGAWFRPGQSVLLQPAIVRAQAASGGVAGGHGQGAVLPTTRAATRSVRWNVVTWCSTCWNSRAWPPQNRSLPRRRCLWV